MHRLTEFEGLSRVSTRHIFVNVRGRTQAGPRHPGAAEILAAAHMLTEFQVWRTFLRNHGFACGFRLSGLQVGLEGSWRPLQRTMALHLVAGRGNSNQPSQCSTGNGC